MRLLAPLIIALFGGSIGLAVNYFFKKSWLAYPVAAIIGALSAFAGLVIRDVFDIVITNDQLFDALLAALLCALLVSLVAHIITSVIKQPW